MSFLLWGLQEDSSGIGKRYMTNKIFKIILKEFVAVLLAVFLSVAAELCILSAFFYNLSMDSILYHLRYFRAIFYGDAVSIIVTYMLVWTLISSAFVYWLVSKYLRRIRFVALALASVPFFVVFLYNIGFFSYIRSSFNEDEIYERNYAKAGAEFRSSERPNLILLYLESMEREIKDPADNKRNVLEQLTELANENISFSRQYGTIGTYYTMGAIVGGWCGIPLSNTAVPDKKENLFLPNAVCLPDILAANGYSLFFIKGSSVKFAGLDIFLRNHKFASADIVGCETLSSDILKDNTNAWGLPDVQVYSLFKQKILSFAQQKKPFFAAMETIDTHSPYAKLAPQCSGSSQNIADVFSCADKQAAEFVDWFKRQSFAANTVLIVLGDHQKWELKFNDEDDKFWANNHGAAIYNLFVNSRVQPQGSTNRMITTLDLYPSILESLGMVLPHHRAGLGVSAFAPAEQQTLIEQIGVKELNKNLYGRGKYYKSFVK